MKQVSKHMALYSYILLIPNIKSKFNLVSSTLSTIFQSDPTSYYNLSKHLFVPYVLRGPLTDLRQTWWVYVGWPPICPWGVLFRKGQRLHGSTGHFRFPLYYIIMWQPHSTRCNGTFCLASSRSNSAPFAVLHVNDVCRWTWQLLFRSSFSKRSTGRRVNGSTGQRVKRLNRSTSHFHYIIYDSRRRQPHATPLQKAHGLNGLTGQWVDGSTGQTGRRVTFTFTILYMIADDARLTPPRCKKHTAYDDTRLTPHRC